MLVRTVLSAALIAASLTTPVLARDGSKSVASMSAHEWAHDVSAGKKDRVKRKEVVAELDAIYAKEVLAWNDFVSTGRIAGYTEAFDLNEQYAERYWEARTAKSINKNFKTATPVSDFGQCCPFEDEDNDGYSDGSLGDPTGPDGPDQGNADIGGIQ